MYHLGMAPFFYTIHPKEVRSALYIYWFLRMLYLAKFFGVSSTTLQWKNQIL